MDARSIFSTNTYKTTLNIQGTGKNSQSSHNPLHKYVKQYIESACLNEHSYIARIISLQLLLRENILIYTDDRLDVRELWAEISQCLRDKNRNNHQKKARQGINNIFVIDETVDISKILNECKDPFSRVLLYDISKLNTVSVNFLINYMSKINIQHQDQPSFSIIAIQSAKSTLSPHISDLFSMIFHHSQTTKMSKMIDNLNKQDQLKNNENGLGLQLDDKNSQSKEISFQKFEHMLKQNYQIAVVQNQEEGFLKPFLMIFQLNLNETISSSSQNIGFQLSVSKWKKMIKFLKFIGLNKHQDLYKKMGLSQMLFIPSTLATNLSEYCFLKAIVLKTISKFIPFYGRQKFSKSVASHFWLSNSIKEEILGLQQKPEIRDSISFFYPCAKFSDIAQISYEFNEKNKEQNIFYKIVGYQKKLMSDHHYQLDQAQSQSYQKDSFYKNISEKTKNKYRLRVQIVAHSPMTLYIGINCYDRYKNPINPIQACRIEESQVKFAKIEGNWLYVENIGSQGLNVWPYAHQNEIFNYQRAIGVYFHNQQTRIPEVNNILSCKQKPHSTNPQQSDTYSLIDLENKRIKLTHEGKSWFMKNVLYNNDSDIILMSHYEGGSFCTASQLQFQSSENISKEMKDTLAIGKLQQLEFFYSDYKYQNSGNNFLPGTKYIRVVILSNSIREKNKENISEKKGQFKFRNIKWSQISQ